MLRKGGDDASWVLTVEMRREDWFLKEFFLTGMLDNSSLLKVFCRWRPMVGSSPMAEALILAGPGNQKHGKL